MKLIRLSFLLMCCFLMNAFQATAQCSITNLNITSITCANVVVGGGGTTQDLTYCGTFLAANTNGSYDFEAFNQFAGVPSTASLSLASDGLISFCVTFSNVGYEPEGLAVGEFGNMACTATFRANLPSPCPATGTCALSNLNVSNITCDGNGGMRVVGSFTAANASGNYRVQINGVPPNFAQTQNLPASPMNGTVNFDIVIPSYDFSNTGSGVTIEDNIYTCTSNMATGVAIPANAAACPSDTPAVAQAPIPTMSQWGLLIFGLLVLNLGVIFLYKKQTDFIK